MNPNKCSAEEEEVKSTKKSKEKIWGPMMPCRRSSGVSTFSVLFLLSRWIFLSYV
jgi:hypothetical protein